MSAKSLPGDERNGSFGPPTKPLQDHKPGHYPSASGQQPAEAGHYRRTSGDAKDLPKDSLAKRIRGKGGM